MREGRQTGSASAGGIKKWTNGTTTGTGEGLQTVAWSGFDGFSKDKTPQDTLTWYDVSMEKRERTKR